MKIRCEKCGVEGNLDDAKIPEGGTRVKCPRCGGQFFVQKNRPESSPADGTLMDSWSERGWSASLPEASKPAAPAASPSTSSTTETCFLCKKTYSRMDIIRFGDKWVCAGCKPSYLQMLQQGLSKPGEMEYAGFWIRFAAKFLDGLVLLVINYLVAIPFAFAQATPPELGKVLGMAAARSVLQIVLAATYATIFIGKYRATLGKMACGLVVVTSDGGQVSYMRALGRHFSEFLSGIILAIGYIMAAFDSEKRALHDRICDTRVIKK